MSKQLKNSTTNISPPSKVILGWTSLKLKQLKLLAMKQLSKKHVKYSICVVVVLTLYDWIPTNQ